MKPEFRVLVVDQDPQTSEDLRRMLKGRGYVVQSAASSQEALEHIRHETPDIVLSEIQSPEVDGLDLCTRLKSSPRTADSWFLAMTERSDSVMEEEILARGADGLVRKPIQEAILLARLQAAERMLLRARGHELARQQMYREMDVLLVQEGGCAPGYNPVTAFLVDDLEQLGRRVYCAREGFRSLVQGRDEDFVRLVYDPREYRKTESIPGVFNATFLTEAAGGQFRSERYNEFKDPENQMIAVRNLLARNVRAVIAIGGNGTLRGIRELASRLPPTVQTSFIPVTVDSDVSGTECIGQHTGVECGAEKLRQYMADARTHKRVYIVEFMGARGGFHALYSCLGARAHMAVLPDAKPDFQLIMEELNRRDYAVIAVAEGYGAGDPRRLEQGLNAAEYFVKQLLATGIQPNKRVIAEPFSRALRGAHPNNLDLALARRMAWAAAEAVRNGMCAVMPAVSGEDLKFLPFWEIDTEKTVSRELARLADRLTPRRLEAPIGAGV